MTILVEQKPDHASTVADAIATPHRSPFRSLHSKRKDLGVNNALVLCHPMCGEFFEVVACRELHDQNCHNMLPQSAPPSTSMLGDLEEEPGLGIRGYICLQTVSSSLKRQNLHF